MTPHLRRARLDEAEAVSRLLGVVWHATHDEMLGWERVEQITRKWHAPAQLAGQIAEPDALFLVAETDDGRLAGHIFARPFLPDRIDVLRLYVDPAAQGAGLGGALLGAALAGFPGARRLRLEVQAENTRAIGFYQAHGLRVVGNTQDGGGMTDIPALVMEKSL